MSSRLIALCLLAYPRSVRRRDRAHLHDLAMDLAHEHGSLREAFGLIRGGWAERRRQSRASRAIVAVGGAAFLAFTALTWTAAAQSGTVEEDLFTCKARCVQAQAEARSRVRDGWTCTESRESDRVQWRCVRD